MRTYMCSECSDLLRRTWGFHGWYRTDSHLGFTLIGFYIATGISIPSITGLITHCHTLQWFKHCSVIDPSTNPYISVLNPLIECDILHDSCNHKIFAVLRYTRSVQISSVSWWKPALMRRHSCFHYEGPQRNASLKKLKLFEKVIKMYVM
jgi:hypothetical protein